MRRDLIEIVPHNPSWGDLFEAQARTVERALEDWILAPVEHIGSTAVPGLAAKPIIDMVALVGDFESFAAALPALEGIGWLPAPEPGDRDRLTWSVCFPSLEHRSHHLHVVERDSPDWPDWLLFRDYLRSHRAAADRYADLKRQLAAADGRDRPRYRAGKSALIEELLVPARAWTVGDRRHR